MRYVISGNDEIRSFAGKRGNGGKSNIIDRYLPTKAADEELVRPPTIVGIAFFFGSDN